MVARIWRGVTHRTHAKKYFKYMEKTGVVDCLKSEGNEGVLIFENTKNESTNFTFISFWKTLKFIKNFSKSESNKAVLYTEDEKYLIKYERQVELVNCYFFKRAEKNSNHDLQLPPHVII